MDELRALAGRVEGDYFFIGDVIVYRPEIEAKAASGAQYLWPNGVFTYVFTGQTAGQQALFEQACQNWTVGTGIRCRRGTGSEPNFARVETHQGNACGIPGASCSLIGMQRPGIGAQFLRIWQGVWDQGNIRTIEHEIGHALGLVHEQNRPGRGAFVTVQFQNIIPAGQGQYYEYHQDTVTNLTRDYDYRSVMHYRVCDAAANLSCDAGNPATRPFWTMIPGPCALLGTEIGGGPITELDLDGIRSLYGGPVMALFPSERSPSCGVLPYSAAQVQATCGANCSAAAPVTWLNVNTHYDRGCGWLTPRPGINFCSSRGAEFITQWTDKDKFHSSCWGGTLVERWTQCGCSRQELAAQCTNLDAPVDFAKLSILSTSADPRERQTGLFIERVLQYRNRGYLSPYLADNLSEVFLNIYVQGEAEQIGLFLCMLKIVITINRATQLDDQLSYWIFARLAANHGIQLPMAFR